MRNKGLDYLVSKSENERSLERNLDLKVVELDTTVVRLRHQLEEVLLKAVQTADGQTLSFA